MNILKSLLLLHLIARCQSETLIYENLFQSVPIDWYCNYQSSCKQSTCQSQLIFGGYGLLSAGMYIIKTIELKPHYQLRLKFLFWRFNIIQTELLTVLRNIYRIDHWNGERFKVYIDNIEKHNEQYYHSSSLNNLCGSTSYNDETFQLDLTTYHQSPTTQILMTGNVYWGISELQLYIEECPDGCDSCDQNGCFNQILYIQYFTAKIFYNVDFNEEWLSFNGIIYNYQWSLGDYFIQQLITYQSTKTIQLAPHDAVSISLKIITINYYHQFDILIDDALVQLILFHKQYFLEVILIYNFKRTIIVSNLQRQVQRSNRKLIIYLDTSNDSSDQFYLITNQINIQQYMHKKNSITLTIRHNSNLRYSTYNSYQGIRDFQLFIRQILKDDYCFDENIQPFDGCFAEIYDCVEGCSNCVRGVCLECQQDWQYYEQNKNCIPICGDSIITYFEECDDGNTKQYDGCYQCKYSCQQNCLLCQFGQCLITKTSQLQDQNFPYKNNLNQKLTIAQKDQNHNQCQFLYDSLECYQYLNQLTWLFLTCDSQYKMNEKRLKQYREKKCGDLIITCDEECDDGNKVEHDGCHMCRYSCPLYCSECQFGNCKQCQPRYELIQGQCKFICDGSESQEDQENRGCYNRIINLIENGHYYQIDCQLTNKQQIQINIKNQQYYSVYVNDRLQHNLFNILNSKYKVVSSLTCNLYDFGIFGYFYNQCRIPAIQHCKETLYDNCLKCEENYKIENNKQTCTPICNDGIVIEQELCDDQNNLQFDGCYKCQSSCLLECLSCVENKCYQCLDGWQLIDYGCYQYCGDGQVAESSMEQCDDGNYDNGDGCFECKFECVPYCRSCADRSTCLVCEIYFEFSNNSCRPICGDENIVIGFEECEDGNNIPYDGCFNCMFQCEKECQTCVSGICVECIQGYLLTKEYCQVNNQTQTITDDEDTEVQKKCGDAIYSDDEECDDGNQNNGDGCSKLCRIEQNWFCNNQLKLLSVCSPNTTIELQYLNQTQQNQYVQLSFSNKVKLTETILNFTNSIKPTILSIQENIYVITIIPIDYNILLDVNYVFQIKILESIQTQIALAVEINANLEDQNQMKVNTNLQTINLQQPKILNKNQLQTANNFQALGNWMMIGLASSSFLLFIFGNPSQCLEILDTLQFQSYLKFIQLIYVLFNLILNLVVNVEFPQNILIYFESSEFVQINSYYFYLTINPVLIKLQMYDVFQQLIGYNYLDSVGKLFEYKLNADLLVNIYGQLTQIVLLFGLYIIIKYYKKLIYTKCFGNKYIYYFRLINNKIIQSIGIKFYYLNKSICKANNIFTMEGLIQLFHANSWDLIFKILMYLVSNYKLGLREIISNILSICYIISIIIIVAQNFRRHNHKINLKDLRAKQHDDIILLKKLFFLVVLIIIQSYPLFQCILLTCVLFWYLGSLISINFAANKIDLLIIIWMEAPVQIVQNIFIYNVLYDQNCNFFDNTLSCMIYCTDFDKYFSIDQQLQAGFIQISFLILSLISPLVRCGYQCYIKVSAYYLKHIKISKPIVLDVRNILLRVDNK